MSDTDKYEGHTEGKWIADGDDERGWAVRTPKHDDPYAFIERRNDDGEVVSLSEADAQLIADAPLLLEEVKRLNRFAHCAMNFMSKHDLHFQFLNEHGVFTAPDGGSISMFIPYSHTWDDETKVSSESIQFTVRGEEE